MLELLKNHIANSKLISVICCWYALMQIRCGLRSFKMFPIFSFQFVGFNLSTRLMFHNEADILTPCKKYAKWILHVIVYTHWLDEHVNSFNLALKIFKTTRANTVVSHRSHLLDWPPKVYIDYIVIVTTI